MTNTQSPMTYQEAHTEAERCLQCFDAPCISACPTHINIPKFIWMIKTKNVLGAAEVVKTSNAMANVCGKVCPEEIFCQSVCNRGKMDSPIQIRELHFYSTQFETQHGYSRTIEFPKSGKKVAVVGGGPAGLGCAFELTKLGHAVTLYDSQEVGGVPKNSIPAFRLSEDELRSDINFLSNFFEIKKVNVDKNNFDEIKKSNDAIFVGVGLGRDKALGVKGEDLQGVFPVLKFLEDAKANEKKINIGESVVIVGGGNVSLDAAATAKRLGASEVVLIYRRSEAEMKVWKSELDEARKQGVEMRFLTNPVEIIGNNNRVTGIKCRRTQLSKEKDQSGRYIPLEVAGSDYIIKAETVVIAIGQEINADFTDLFKRTKKGFIEVNDNFQTSVTGVFAGGDAISGEGTIVQSVAHGKSAAYQINEYLNEKS